MRRISPRLERDAMMRIRGEKPFRPGYEGVAPTALGEREDAEVFAFLLSGSKPRD
jgi:hypothetical protein